MNCANHPDLPVSAYCQNCGKPLCTQCVRSVAGVVYCEPCLAARLHAGGTYSGRGPSAPVSSGWSPVADPLHPPTAQASFYSGRGGAANSPVLAGLLGIIPGVGAMYNGQFIKALAHVVVFIVLIGVSSHFPLAGLLIAAWIFYQIFDAIQTAIARRDGRPLPDPFGLNDLGQRMGVPPAAAGYSGASPMPPFATHGVPPSGEQPVAAGQAAGSEAAAGPAGAAPDWHAWGERVAAAHAERAAGVPFAASGYAPVEPPPQGLAYGGARPEPIGAIVLIAVGMLFLLSTLDIFRLDWVGRGWPVLIIVIGAWLLVRRARTVPPAGGGL